MDCDKLPDEALFTSDRLLGGRLLMMQPLKGYRAAIDPILLAAATAVQAGGQVLELGIGTAAAALCLAWRVPEVRLTGLELRPEIAALARQNVAANGFGERVTVVTGSLLHPPAGLLDGQFDHVMMNPPYQAAARHTASPDPAKAAANGENEGSLADWLKAAAKALRPRGGLTLIHRADRLDEILALLRIRFGGIIVCPLWPRPGNPARRVLIAARLGSRAPLVLSPGFALHQEDGGNTPAAEAVLRQGAALPLLP